MLSTCQRGKITFKLKYYKGGIIVANIKSAAKRAKTNEARRVRNVAQKSALRTSVKKFLTAVDSNDDRAQDLLTTAKRALDKAVSKGIIHKNNAARKKSRLSKKIQAANN